jgi:tetratricopeptide (TPR) repeat protein
LIRETFEGTGKGLEHILEHLSSCAKCRARLDRLKLTEQRNHRFREQEDYGPALDRSFDAFQLRQAMLEKERTEAPPLLDCLVALAPGQQQLLLRNSHRFKTWGVLGLLIRRGKEETFTDPWHAEEILQLALEVSAHLPSALYGRSLIEDMRARVWGGIANARRARMDLTASEEAFKEAFRHLHRGTEDPLERAVLFNLQASLHRTQQRFEESLHLLHQATSTFRRLGETHRVSKAIVNTSSAHRFMGNLERAISLLYQSLELINPSREPRLALYALNNLADALSTSGRFIQAQSALLRARPLYRQFPDPKIQSGRMWVEAKVAYGLGHQRAEELLQGAYERFISAHHSHDVELIERDLASVRANTAKYPDWKHFKEAKGGYRT